MEIINNKKILGLKEIDKVFFNRMNTLKNIFKNRDEELIIFDVGAHIGESVEEFKNYFINANIHCFEPAKESFNKLKNINYSNIVFNNFALGDKNSEKIFYYYDVSSNSSFLPIKTDSKVFKNKVHSKLNKIKKVSTYTVKVKTLDEYISQNNIQTIDILKVDVQGYTREVLEGAKKALEFNKISVLILEIIFDEIYGRRDSMYEIEKHLIPYGYKLWDISHIYKDLNLNRTNWIDAIYVKESYDI